MRVTKIKCFGRTFLQVARSHQEEVLPLELEEKFQPRQLDLDEPEDNETETARALWGTREAGENILIWSIHSLQTWHALCDTRDLDEKQYGLLSRKCVAQRVNLDHYRCHFVPACCLAVCASTSASVLTW